MRRLLLLALLSLWPMACFGIELPIASAPEGAAPGQAYADFCCNQITYTCLELKPGPAAICLPHQCVLPYQPCPSLVCLPTARHLPVVPCLPCPSEVCLSPVCHLPVVATILIAPSVSGCEQKSGECLADE